MSGLHPTGRLASLPKERATFPSQSCSGALFSFIIISLSRCILRLRPSSRFLRIFLLWGVVIHVLFTPYLPALGVFVHTPRFRPTTHPDTPSSCSCFLSHTSSARNRHYFQASLHHITADHLTYLTLAPIHRTLSHTTRPSTPQLNYHYQDAIY